MTEDEKDEILDGIDGVLKAIEKIAEWKPYIKELDAAVSKMFDKAKEDLR